ncbi:hypothetical protein KC366_g10917 [Hortaea werneckii]|uniref:DUF1168 domain-containing protein n=1 Tax=Hortaea werneckii TaxID=91943 RepID=A0A3M7I9B3_HORWE|nr:hypothetical protein KC358_g9262 [Hortaea werneckii]KAI6983564.1 hypothetical protein KC329_g8500 [Hortaea werneckii]KAI7023022.1 hypothetical protein KC362_g12826 [Hortaea werneckii]KAI7028935.1 hypothetical protein KC366_g10917 [Hortaea werneckii]KAI7128115.1 hypothetical protein KC337_g8640 [Hortaea werneckii]
MPEPTLDPRSHRPIKKSRPNTNDPHTQHQAYISTLFAHPDREIHIPSPSDQNPTGGAPAPPEIVTNVQGSSAGAGSGEFHVYKASRRRENERLKAMDEANEREVRDREFEDRVGEMRRRDEEVLRRNREKREKARARKRKGGKGGGGGGGGEGTDGKEGGEAGTKRKLGPARVVGAGWQDGEGEVDGRPGQKDGERDVSEGGEDGTEGGGGGGITIHDDD